MYLTRTIFQHGPTVAGRATYAVISPQGAGALFTAGYYFADSRTYLPLYQRTFASQHQIFAFLATLVFSN